MTITVADLTFFQSERMTDEADGGGRMTAVEIASGVENTIFDDLSDVDRAAGDVSIRKAYALVCSDGPDKYLDSGVVLLRPPQDTSVSVTLFSTGDFYDERTQLKDRLEAGISRAARYVAYLLGSHSPGQRAVMLWARLSTDVPDIGNRLEVVAREGLAEIASQVLWITRVVADEVTMYDVDGAYVIRLLVLELAEPLRYSFEGTEPTRIDPPTPETVCYNTRYNQDAIQINGIAPLSAGAETGDYSITVASIYSPLIPTAFAETALTDVNPGGDTAALVAANAETVSTSTEENVVGPGKSLFLGSPCMPGTVVITGGGSTFTDDNGVMRLSGSDVGSIDYGAGSIVWAATCPALGTSAKDITFQPGATPTRVADSASQIVTIDNRGYVWVLTLAPIPKPGTLRVAYRVNNEWYVLADLGGGRLAGADPVYGSGQLNFTTGTLSVTTGALPDGDSEILYTWATAVDYIDRSNTAPAAVVVRGQTANPNVLPGTVSVAWGASTLTDGDSDGVLSGAGGEGAINYTSGAWWVQPTALPPKGAEFTIDYQYGDPTDLVTDTWAGPALGASGDLELTLSDLPKPGTLHLTIEATVADYLESTGSVAEDIPPPPPLDPDQDDPSPPAPPPSALPVTYRLSGTLINAAGGVATASSSGTYADLSAAVAAVSAVNAVGSVSGVSLPGSGSTATFAVGGVTFRARAVVGTVLTNWTFRVSASRI